MRRVGAGFIVGIVPFSMAGPQAGLRKALSRFQNGSMEAKNDRGSLNSEIIAALETEAAESEKRRQVRTLRRELDRFATSLPLLDASAPLIRADRKR
jgi:hypothetical protein